MNNEQFQQFMESAEAPIFNSSIKSLTPYKDNNVYSKGDDTFDEFDYKEEELEELEKTIKS
ncbi:44851_t:CDS:2 [Gigaspora margarita]|uniref:44851_t:CDS:1 n=1 Tax=Gigaspora margarita TaxID=4874 RepID=A0ABN7VW75_GIGMA|nr:44851_t:CDS:2 [Gigaspora margarita]